MAYGGLEEVLCLNPHRYSSQWAAGIVFAFLLTWRQAKKHGRREQLVGLTHPFLREGCGADTTIAPFLLLDVFRYHVNNGLNVV